MFKIIFWINNQLKILLFNRVQYLFLHWEAYYELGYCVQFPNCKKLQCNLDYYLSDIKMESLPIYIHGWFCLNKTQKINNIN